MHRGFGRVWTEFGRVWQEFDLLRGELEKVREDIRAGDEETRNRMLILHEGVVARLKLLQEGIERVNGGAKRERSARSGKR